MPLEKVFLCAAGLPGLQSGLVGIFCETSVVLAFWEKKGTGVHAKWKMQREEFRTQKGSPTASIKRHYNLLFPDTTNQTPLKSRDESTDESCLY